MMTKEEKKTFIATRAAKELAAGDFVNLGVGIPSLIPSLLPPDVSVVLQTENGIVNTGTLTPDNSMPDYAVDAGGSPAVAALGGAYVDSALSHCMIRGGHLDAVVIGTLEVDEHGNLANWIIPGKMVPGIGGGMDLCVGCKKVIVAMEHTAKGKIKIVHDCSLPYTAINCVDIIVTEMCVFKFEDGQMVLAEINPDYTLNDIAANTEASYVVADQLKDMATGLAL